jgi:hypothetical protein
MKTIILFIAIATVSCTKDCYVCTLEIQKEYFNRNMTDGQFYSMGNPTIKYETKEVCDSKELNEMENIPDEKVWVYDTKYYIKKTTSNCVNK